MVRDISEPQVPMPMISVCDQIEVKSDPELESCELGSVSESSDRDRRLRT